MADYDNKLLPATKTQETGSVIHMPIKNMTTNKIIAASSRIADSMLSRTLGLMCTKPQQAALILKFEKEERISLHMMFVLYPIDVIFANREKEVVDVKENFRPFEMYASDKKATYAIEVPAGTVSSTGTKTGHRIAFLAIKEKNYINGKSITVTEA